MRFSELLFCLLELFSLRRAIECISANDRITPHIGLYEYGWADVMY